MNLILTRNLFQPDGIFGELQDETGTQVAVTLEHAYDAGHGDGSYAPKLQPGTYLCRRGPHQLHGMTEPFITFEITGVVGHTNILFHWGNYNKDSEGCVLLGRRIVPNPDAPSDLMITSSRNTFLKFLDLQRDLDSFTLTVKDKE